MSDETDPADDGNHIDHGHIADLGGIPSWYEEIYPAGEFDGFYRKMGNHSLAYVERRTHQLVVSFDNLSDAGHPGYDKEAWAGAFCRYNSWSHLGIFTQDPSWFRSAALIRYLEKLRDEGFFRQFANVTFCGTSMGGFAALAFCGFAPGCNVIAFSPQTTLIRHLIPWEKRFKKADLQDWTLPYSDAARDAHQAGKIYMIYDPFHSQDRMHCERLTSDNAVHLRAPGLGHRTALLLNRMGALKPVMGEGIFGSLSNKSFAALIRDRGRYPLYRENMTRYLRMRGLDRRVPALEEAYERRNFPARARRQAVE